MTEQPTGEWEEMSEQQKSEIRERLHHVIEDIERAAYRGRLARASRPSARVCEAMRHSGI